jgi:outer membrane protein OmpA-like peptidoglycan-associated protein
MRFAKVLLAQRSAWQSLLVSGHGDNRGKVQRTKFFSDTRALKVKALLQKAGIDAALITAEGVGLAHMLEGFASAAPQQRRVEIVVKGTGPTSSLREMLDRALAD